MLPRLAILASKKGRETYRDRVAKELSVSPVHIFTVEPVDGTISIDQMRQLFPLFLTRYPDTRMIVIDSFDAATVEAQNSLLKLLEEKTANTLFLLFATQPEGVLPTIRSRTQVLYPEGKEPVTDVLSETARLVGMLDGSLQPLNQADHLLKTKEEVIERIDHYILYYRKELIKKPEQKTSSILQKLLTTRKEIQTANANPQFAYDILLIFITELATIK